MRVAADKDRLCGGSETLCSRPLTQTSPGERKQRDRKELNFKIEKTSKQTVQTHRASVSKFRAGNIFNYWAAVGNTQLSSEVYNVEKRQNGCSERFAIVQTTELLAESGTSFRLQVYDSSSTSLTAHTIGCENNRNGDITIIPIPENKRQNCFSRPLKLEVHVRYWTTDMIE